VARGHLHRSGKALGDGTGRLAETANLTSEPHSTITGICARPCDVNRRK
jgi:hypothetical protein